MQKARRHPKKGAPTACGRMVSGSVSLPCPGSFSPFPHGTGALSVSQEYLALADGPAGFAQGCTCPALLRIPLPAARFACTGPSPSLAPFSKGFQFIVRRMPWSYNPTFAVTNMVWAAPLSLATTNGITFVFSSSGYLDVSVPRVRLPCGILYLQYSGLPHSDTCGSACMCQSPQLFAACHVLLRLWEPRHPPYALAWLVRIAPQCPFAAPAHRAGAVCRTNMPMNFLFLALPKKPWRIPGSNRWPPACKAGALAS